jgi:vacuolar-type H+-ATPase subunit I/STV1
MLLSMAKVQIIGTKRYQDEVVQILHRLGVLQIDAWNETRALSQQRLTLDDQAVQIRQRLAFAATRVEAVLAALPAFDCLPSSDYEEFYARPLDSMIRAVETDLEQVSPQTQALAKRHDQLDEQLASFARYEATLEQLLPLVPAAVDLERFTTTVVWVENRYQSALENITQQLEELTEGQCEVISREVVQDIRAAVLVFPKAKARSVADLLARENIAQVRLPTELADQSFQQALAHLRQRLGSIPSELVEAERQGEALARAWRPRLLAWQALLHDQLNRIEVCTNFGQTDFTFVIEGWVPERYVAKMEATLRQEAGDEIIVTVLPLSA